MVHLYAMAGGNLRVIANGWVRMVVAGLALIGSFLLGMTIMDRDSPVTDVHIMITDTGPITPDTRIEIDVVATYLRACRADVKRALYDAQGTKFVLAELILAPASPGRQHSVSTLLLPANFAAGPARYVSNVTYACTWFQQTVWLLAAPERVAHFNVLGRAIR